MARNRQIDLMQSGLIPILGAQPGDHVPVLERGISLGGHVGGLIGGLIVTLVVEELAKRRRGRDAGGRALRGPRRRRVAGSIFAV